MWKGREYIGREEEGEGGETHKREEVRWVGRRYSVRLN